MPEKVRYAGCLANTLSFLVRRALLSPDPNPVPVKRHVSPAYADHLGSNLSARGNPDLSVASQPVVYQHQPSTQGSELARKREYAEQLREQMRRDIERKEKVKEEQVS